MVSAPRRGPGMPGIGVVTLWAQPDEEHAFGPAAALVDEWRQLQTIFAGRRNLRHKPIVSSVSQSGCCHRRRSYLGVYWKRTVWAMQQGTPVVAAHGNSSVERDRVAAG